MISVKQAEAIILSHVPECSIQSVALPKAIGKILQEPIYTDRDLPPYNRVAMDGIAINFASFKKGNRQFKIEGVGAAGSPKLTLNLPDNCTEIMTGAVLPNKTDTVIRYEDVEIENGLAKVMIDNCTKGQNIHPQGKDHKKETLLIDKGTLLSAAEIGIAASVGKANLQVAVPPKIVIISTGNELVEVDGQPLPYQIRSSNVYQIQAQLKHWGITADRLHIPDELPIIKKQLNNAIEQYDVLLLSGGVSKGKFDFLPQALNDLGVEQAFHKITQRPGKPFWFGTNSSTTVFAFPGNPVSTFTCLIRYFKIWLDAFLGVYLSDNSKLKAVQTKSYALLEDVHFKPDLTYFLPVKLMANNKGETLAKPSKGNGSGDFANLAKVDGFLELPKGSDIYKKNTYYRYFNFR